MEFSNNKQNHIKQLTNYQLNKDYFYHFKFIYLIYLINSF